MRTLLFALLCGLLLVSTSLAQDLIGPDSYPDSINPLTGLPVDDPSVLDRRPLIIKIVNAPAEARPQWGLLQADIVWEYLLAGGYTRFAGVFLSETPERVGPVRSLRLIDFEIARIYRGIMTTSGMSVGTYETLIGDPLMSQRTISGTGPCPALCRDFTVGRPYEFTLFADAAALRELAAEKNLDLAPEPLTGMAFTETLPANGHDLDSIEILYNATQVLWRYNPERNVWMREQDGEVHIDADGVEVFADNVMILEEDHTVQPFVREEYWGYSNFAYSANFIGSGRALLLRDGQYFEGEWRRETREDNLSFYDTAGNVLPFKPGHTFFNIVPRWVNGYQLIFHTPTTAIARVNTSSMNLRSGPSTNAAQTGAAFQNDELRAIGRNGDGSWIQVLNAEDQVLWASIDLIVLDTEVMNLPLVRPTIE